LLLTDFRAKTLKVNINGREYVGPDFSRLQTACPFMGLVPQWDFLSFVSSKARVFAQFDLRMNTRVVDVLRESGRVVGVRCESEQGSFDVRAELVVAADGRSSTIRSATKRKVDEVGIPIDVLWFRLERPAGKVEPSKVEPSKVERHVREPSDTVAWIRDGRMLVTIPRRDHYQVAMIIKKGALAHLQQDGLQAFHDIVAGVCPPLRSVVGSIHDWQDVKLLSVQINRLKQWYDEGLLFIGDAAHAMSPVGGVGINLAIQDAVATANRISGPLLAGTLGMADLVAVQQRREPAARKTQWLQMIIHRQLFSAGREPGRPFSPPWYMRYLMVPLSPILRRLAARWIGIGFQPEHIDVR